MEQIVIIISFFFFHTKSNTQKGDPLLSLNHEGAISEVAIQTIEFALVFSTSLNPRRY